MTDNEILREEEYVINSLKFLIRGGSILGERIFNLINRRMAEIERLENKVFVLENDLEKAESLSEALGNDVDIKLNHIYYLEEKLAKAKSEAIKEVAEKVGHLICINLGVSNQGYRKLSVDIQNLVKEMVGEEE